MLYTAENALKIFQIAIHYGLDLKYPPNFRTECDIVTTTSMDRLQSLKGSFFYVFKLQRFIWAYKSEEKNLKISRLQSHFDKVESRQSECCFYHPKCQSSSMKALPSHFRLCETLPQALISIVYGRANRGNVFFSSQLFLQYLLFSRQRSPHTLVFQ